MRFVQSGVACDVEIQAVVVAAGDADPSASNIECVVRKWRQGAAEDGYYYTGAAWQVGATTVTSAQGDFHAHVVTIDATRMIGLDGHGITVRPASTTELGATIHLHVLDEILTTAFLQSIQAISGAAVNSAATSYTLTTGTQSSGTFEDTASIDGEHQHTDDGGAVDLYYEFSIGGDGVPTGVLITGRINGNNDDLDGIYAYNWGGSSWDRIGDFTGQAGSGNVARSYSLLTSHVGTGANLGKVRIRFWAAAGLSSSTLSVDQIITSYVIANRTVGYSLGAIWVDTNASNTNTENFVDGTADNPVSTWAAALTLRASLGISNFQIANGSTITLTTNTDNYTLGGFGWALALGGQSCSAAHFEGASVTGTCTGSGVRFVSCDLATGMILNTSAAQALRCAIVGDIVLSAASDYFFDQCFSGIAGTATPSIDFGSAVGSTNLNMRHYSGGIEIKNMGVAGDDLMSLEGHGQIIVHANCAGGTIAMRGNFDKTDNSIGAVTFSDDATFTKDGVAAQVDTVLTAAHDSGSWAGSLTGTSMVTITVDDGSNPLENVLVGIYNSDNTGNALRSSFTNAAGQVTFTINDGSYKVRLSLGLYAFTVPETLTVSGTTTDTYSGSTLVSITPPAGADLCRIFGRILNAGGTAVEGATIKVTADTPQDLSGVQLGTPLASTTTNSDGDFTLDLQQGAAVLVTISWAGITKHLIVPSTTTQDITTWWDS